MSRGPRAAHPVEEAHVQIVVTSGSGKGRAVATAAELRGLLERRGRSAHVRRFDRFRDLLRWSASCPRRWSHLVAVGGDATMSAAATAAIRHQVPLLPVPSGFGNLFAGALGHGGGAEAAADVLERGRVLWLDAGVCAGELFLSHHSFGVLEDIQEAVEQGPGQPRSRLLRWLAYYRTGLRFLTGGVPWSIRVDVDGSVIARHAALVTVANVPAYGHFLPLTPEASPTDGLLDVFVLPRSTGAQLWGRLLRLLLGGPTRGEEAIVCRGRTVSVTVPGRPTHDLRVVPGILPVLVPGDARAGLGAAASAA